MNDDRSVAKCDAVVSDLSKKVTLPRDCGRAGACPSRGIAPYPVPAGAEASPDFSLEVDGHRVGTECLRKPLPEDTPDWFRVPETQNMAVCIAAFGCDGPCMLTIRPRRPVARVVVRPQHRGIPVAARGTDLVLQLSGPCQLQVDLDDLPPLLVFADPPEEDVPAPNQGATRFFGPGIHEPGLITLKDNDRVYLAPGALVYGGLRGSPHGARIFGRGILDGSRVDENHMVLLADAAGVEFNGITIRCGKRNWLNRLDRCENMVYRNVKLLSFGPSGDGIDPVNSRHIRIEDSFFRCSDDCISVKAFSGGPPVSDIQVARCVMAGYAFSDGITVGFESDTAFIEDVRVRDCDILCATGGSRIGGHSAFSIVCDGPAETRRILFEDIRVEENVLKLFEAHVTGGATYVKAAPGHIRGVRLKKIRWEVERPIPLHGHDERHLVEDVSFEDCTVAGRPLRMGQIQMNSFVRNVTAGRGER